jgi:GGDEF domain-containing protein
VAIYPDHGKDEATLVRQADDAMYMAKNYGGNQARTAGE